MAKSRTILVTGSAGLIGSETVKRFAGDGWAVVGIDNDMRKQFFGEEASTRKTRDELRSKVPGYQHHEIDIRDAPAVNELFKTHGRQLGAIVHTAAQPSHDWAARDPQMDFTVNANGTLNLLEAARNFCPETPFVFTSTNKVYGDTPNRLPLQELALRWEIEPGHEYEPGISENDEHRPDEALALRRLEGGGRCAGAGIRPLFQHANRLFPGRLPNGPGARRDRTARLPFLLDEVHREWTALSRFRLQRQSRSATTSIASIWWKPLPHSLGRRVWRRFTTSGGVATAIAQCWKRSNSAKKSAERNLTWEYVEDNRIGDHIWWISDVRKFREHYPEWKFRYGLREILEEIHAAL